MNNNLIAKFNYINNQFYIAKSQNNEIKYWIKEGEKISRITDKSPYKNIIQEVVNKLNSYRYMLISQVTFKGQHYLWYLNTYVPQSIFINKTSKEICEYEENKDLYNHYNLNPNILYISENTKRYFNEHIKPKAKIIKVAVLGVIISVTLTLNGCEYLSRNKLDETNINNSKQEELDVTEIDNIKIGTTIEKLLDAISNIHKNYFIDQEETIKVEIINSNGGYPYQKKDECGNVIQLGKIPYRNVIIDEDGNVIEKEDIDTTIQNFLEEYNKEQGDFER